MDKENEIMDYSHDSLDDVGEMPSFTHKMTSLAWGDIYIEMDKTLDSWAMQLALQTCNTLSFSPLTCYYYYGVGTLRHEVNLVLDLVHFREKINVNGDWWLMREGKVDIKGL